MRIKAIIILVLLPWMLMAAPKGKTPLRVGTYELTNSFNRRVQAEKGQSSLQRMWCNSAESVAEAIIDSGCEIIGIQDVCDSIAGRRERAKPIIDILKAKGGDYDGLILSNVNPNFPLEGTMQNGNGVIWKASRFELKDYGILWLSGIYDKPGRDKSLKYGSTSTSVMWVLLLDKEAGKELVFASTALTGPTQYDKGQKVTYYEVNTATAQNLINLMRSDIVPSGVPSIIAVNAHNAPSHDGYKVLTGSRWFDVHDRLYEEGSLDEAAQQCRDCSNAPDESKVQGGRSDHILVDGFGIETYGVLRKKFPTADGSLHYPAYHFPVVADLKY